MSEFNVTEMAMRPASDKRVCFYCEQPIGTTHHKDCVLIAKTVKVRMTAEYEINIPNYWTSENLEFHRNQGSWCSDNAIDELKEVIDKEDCLCHRTKFEYLDKVSGPFLQED